MTKQALLARRPLLLASMVAALAFYLLRDGALAEMWLALIKGAAVGLLAVYAWFRFPSPYSRWLALFLAICALADMAIIFWFEVGGALFFLAHLVAIGLFLRFPRPAMALSQRAFVIALLILTPLLAWQLGGSWHAGLYAVALAGMAASAWASRFPRYRVGVGAVLFVVSDLILFAGMGPLGLESAAHWLVWPLYYSGQFLICVGVIQRLRREHLA